MNKPPSRHKKVIPGASGEAKPAADSVKENTFEQDNPASATITVTAVEIRELTEEEQSLRFQLESQVERAFLSAGQALMELRDRRLYRSTHRTFEEYCRDRFNYSRDAAYLKISATVVYENLQKFLPTIGRQIPMPTNERQLRFLAKAELEPAVQADVWQQAVQQAGNKIPSGRIVKDVVDKIRESTKVPNPYHVGEICVLLPKDNPDLRGKAGYWGVVTHVGDYSCTVQTWDGDYTVKIEHLKSLELLDEDCQFMQQLCVRLRQLHQLASRDSSVDWLLQGLGKQAKPYLSSLQAKLLAAVEREYKIEWRQQK
ncbi:hypothetical protein [Nostoc sp. 'Peltigera membranacea cyanobiont' 232]|uniref:hypothetical protein n=1 Tax=Nostoc sp. 'Peltigera membranacea cyanobiont' 232 TaxID=2014531 RepID=UPI000B95A19A|nr:hypothetical protein [Nostoc sp. 'Peltigera membranacea cyanobiont' 232]OYE00040.1 hypothetical protein CDG79_37400 [Nostoc sp. 'Peltigera membranacea cyanobiont' 232]